MPRPKGRKTGNDLTALAIKRLNPGFHRASRDLYVQVTPRRSMSWINRYTGCDGKIHDKGLGPVDLVTLAEARELVLTHRRMIRDGKDPLARSTGGRTFIDVAKQYYDAHQAEWGSDRYRMQWWQQMGKHIFPMLGEIPIDRITTADVLAVIRPLWGKLQFTPMLRGRIEQVWDYAKAAKMVSGENPAAMKGNLLPLLGNITQIVQSKPQAALPFIQIPEFMALLRFTDTTDARALEFCILTNVRTNATLGAKWSEINLELAVWTVPAERVKGRKTTRKAFRVPLARRAVDILRTLRRYSEFVFTRPDGKPLGENAMLFCVRTFNQVDAKGQPIVVHGFRSTFNDWAAETTSYPHVVIETAMQHTVKGKVEASYRRGDLFGQRTSLMKDWSDYCERKTA